MIKTAKKSASATSTDNVDERRFAFGDLGISWLGHAVLLLLLITTGIFGILGGRDCRRVRKIQTKMGVYLVVHVLTVMTKAKISGKRATAKGLRYGFGIRMVYKTRNPRLVQRLFGHTSLEKTAIYMDLIGEEAHAEVVGAW